MKIEIIHEDNDILVLNKPTGVSVTKDRSGQAELLDLLAAQLPAETIDQLRLVHRIDKDTSGVIMLAKSKEPPDESGGISGLRLRLPA